MDINFFFSRCRDEGLSPMSPEWKSSGWMDPGRVGNDALMIETRGGGLGRLLDEEQAFERVIPIR